MTQSKKSVVHWTVAGTVRLFIALIALGSADPSAASVLSEVDHCGPVDAVGDQPAPDVSYGLARKAWSAQNYPIAVDYVVVVTLRNNDKSTSIHYLGEDEIAAGAIHVDRFSTEEAANPNVPHGTNVFLTLSFFGVGVFGIQLSKPEPTFDLLGTPHLSPAYAFGITESPAAPLIPLPTSSLKTIGKVSVVSRTYDISCDPELTTDEGAIHLVLRPLREPRTNRLREMWIDPQTKRTLKIRTAGNFRAGPPLQTDWLISFATFAGATYIEKEVALGPLDYGRNKIYRDVTINFQNVTPLKRATLQTLIRQRPSQDDLLEPR